MQTAVSHWVIKERNALRKHLLDGVAEITSLNLLFLLMHRWQTAITRVQVGVRRFLEKRRARMRIFESVFDQLIDRVNYERTHSRKRNTGRPINKDLFPILLKQSTIRQFITDKERESATQALVFTQLSDLKRYLLKADTERKRAVAQKV